MPSGKWKKKTCILAYIGKCRYEIQEQNELPVWCTGIFRALYLGKGEPG
jgi:hypothetical protein